MKVNDMKFKNKKLKVTALLYTTEDDSWPRVKLFADHRAAKKHLLRLINLPYAPNTAPKNSFLVELPVNGITSFCGLDSDLYQVNDRSLRNKIKQGIEDARAGRVVDKGSFAQHVDDKQLNDKVDCAVWKVEIQQNYNNGEALDQFVGAGLDLTYDPDLDDSESNHVP